MVVASSTRHPKPSICFVYTSAAMVSLLTPDGPSAMGGAELQLSLIGGALRKRGWDVSFLVGDYGQDERLETSEGIRVLRAYSRSAIRSTAYALCRSLPEFYRSLAEAAADIYVSRGSARENGVVAAFAKLQRRPYVFWCAKDIDVTHGVPTLSRLPITERLPAWYSIRCADAVIAQTYQQRGLLRRYFGRNGTVVPNISPWSDVVPDVKCGHYVLWVGSIQPKKRPHIILDVAARLPEVQFVMAGGQIPAHTESYDSVERRAKETNNVDFLGFVPFDQTKELFQHATVLLSTSDAEEEGFPNVFLQAWSTGTPVVATCDPDEVICRYGLGYHCQSTEEMCERIQEIAHNHELEKEISQRARDYVSKYHALDSISAQLDSFLRELIHSK